MRTASWARAALICLILVLIAILAFLAINVISLLDRGRRADPGAAPTVQGLATSTTPLVSAAGLAESRATDWSEDALLIRAEGNWIAAGEWQQVEVPPVAWAFTYYSPSKRELASVSIKDSQVLWTPPREIPIVPTALDGFPPTFSIDAAWLSFLAAGGRSFLEANPDTPVQFVLQPRSGAPTWTVSARRGDTSTHSRMHALTGVVETP